MNRSERTADERIVCAIHQFRGRPALCQMANNAKSEPNKELLVGQSHLVAHGGRVDRSPQHIQQGVGLGEFECSRADEFAPTGVALLLRRRGER